MEEKLLELKAEAEKCKECELWKNRKKSVFGEGPSDAKVMLIGLGPGYWENEEGKPFVGAAGKLLDKLLSLAGLKREEVYITNVVKCYLPENKVTQEQVRICTSLYLDKQIELIKPKTILTLGNIATQYIFNKFNLALAPMSQIHGRIFFVSSLFTRIKIIPMYHPAAALRNPGLKDIVEKDWKNLKGRL